MNKNLTKYITGPVSLTQREAVLTLAACACGAVACLMTGMTIGMLISPRKDVTIGSHNGSNNEGTFAPSADISKDLTEKEKEDEECVQF